MTWATFTQSAGGRSGGCRRGLDRGAFEGLAITDQLIQSRCPTRHLADHPGLEQLAELLEMRLVGQVEERRICWPALEVQAQGLVQRFPVPFGEGLQITGVLQSLRILSTVTSSRYHCG